jgi:beta-glucosidase
MKPRFLTRKTSAAGLATAALIAAFLVPTAGAGPAGAAPDNTFVPAVDRIFRDHTIDSGARIDDIMAELTLEEKVALSVGGSAIARLGLNSMRGGGGEGLHGVTGSGTTGYTVFPEPLGLSQSWDPDLLYSFGDTLASESIANGGGIQRLTPVLDLTRDPRYGRAYETYGEDAYLTGELGTQATKGMNQRTADGYGAFLPQLKHPLAYNNEVNRLWTNSVIPEQVTNDYYIKAFKYPISAGGAKSLMNSYPLINGKPMSVNPLQRDLLTEWTPDWEGTGHYEYTTTNDYGSGSSMWAHSQRYFDDDPAGWALGIAEGVKNGQMGWSFREFGNATNMVYEALARGTLTESDVDANARRRLSQELHVGDLDHLEPQNPHLARTALALAPQIQDHKEIALRSAQEQIVLLKNDANTLPLSGSATNSVVLLGTLADSVEKNHYTGNWPYAVTIKDALSNKLGASNVAFDQAVETVAIKASNGQYLKAPNNTVDRNPNAAVAPDQPITATGTPAGASVSYAADTDLLFDIYDYGPYDVQMRTPINNRFVQVPNRSNAIAPSSMINNTVKAGYRNTTSGSTYSVFQGLRLAKTDDGKTGIYSPLAGNGGNNGYSASAMAYDVDDEDLNNGTYLRLDSAENDRISADISQGKIGPFRAETHTDGPDILSAPFDANPNDDVVDGLPAEYKFDFETVRSVADAIDETIAAAPAGAPIVLTVGQDAWMTAREAVDLQKTGLSDQQVEQIDHITNDLGRDLILIVKTGSPMAVQPSVANNPKVKAILEIAHSAQEEGSALVSALFDDGYSAPATGFAPTQNKYTPVATFSSYPGYLGSDGTVPPYSPSGRLSATWYANISDMVGASEDHPPASYRWPDYSESGNDNLSNMNGTIPTGLMTYDIVKGERTYQFFQGTPLYSFGHGLTYTDFVYSNVAVSGISNGRFTVTGSVRNAGNVKSDEVVQIYSTFTGTPSRIVQPEQKLIAFDRIRDIAPGETRNFSFSVDLVDKLGVWDVEQGKDIVEPGAYRIRAAKSAADAGTAVTLNVSAANGTAAAVRDLSQEVLAERFDDYSNYSGDVADMELISSSVDLYSNTAVQFREPGAWINFKNVQLPAGTTRVSAKVGANRTSSLQFIALPAGSDPASLASATPLASFVIGDTRPVAGIPSGLGIGPISVIQSGRPQVGSPAGQETLDSQGQPYKNAYIKPGWTRTSRTFTAPAAGRYDIYVRTDNPGTQIEWFKFGSAVETTQSLEITQQESLDSIREQGGELKFGVELTPTTSTSSVLWSVTDEDGEDTNVASIGATSGVLRATGASGGNGTVIVTATSAGRSASKTIMVTNQVASNRVTVNGNPKTIAYPIMRTGNGFGANDNIQRYGGTNQQAVVFTELFSENADSYHQPTVFLTAPVNAFTWTVEDVNGDPTSLATVSAGGLVTATGQGDGKVVVVATLNNNPDIQARRAITLQNQGTKNPVKQIHAENYDIGTGGAASTWAVGGNQMGLYINVANNASLTFKNVDFAALAPQRAAVRVAPNANAAATGRVEIWVDAVGTGTRIADIPITTGNATNTYATFTAPVVGNPQGVHDVIVRPVGAALRVDWFTFSQYTTNNMFLLEALLDAALPLYANQASYAPGWFAAFDAAVQEAQAIVNAGSASDLRINTAIQTLQDLMANPELALFLGILQDAVAAADAILAAPSEYISSTLVGLDAARDAAAAFLTPPPGTTQAQINAAAATLLAAIQATAKKGDTTNLSALYAMANRLNPADYTTASWAPVASALADAADLLALAEVPQAEVDDVFGSLRASLTGLVARPYKGGLEAAIGLAQVIVDNIGAYVPSTVVGLEASLDAAEAVLADGDATAAQVAAAQSDLTAKVMAARLRATLSPLSAAVQQIQAKPVSGYTPASVQALYDALNAGRGLLANPEATQDEVDAATAAIKAAEAALVAVEDAAAAPVEDAAAAPVAGAGASGSQSAAQPVAGTANAGKASVLKTHRPKIAGKAVAGKKLRAVLGSWTKGTKVTYRWYRNGKAISGATAKAYTLRQADIGKRIVVKAIGTKAGYAKVVRASKSIKIKK